MLVNTRDIARAVNHRNSSNFAPSWNCSDLRVKYDEIMQMKYDSLAI